MVGIRGENATALAGENAGYVFVDDRLENFAEQRNHHQQRVLNIIGKEVRVDPMDSHDIASPLAFDDIFDGVPSFTD